MSVENEVTVLPKNCTVKRIGGVKLLLHTYVRRGKVIYQFYGVKILQLKTDIPFFQIPNWTTAE